MKKLSITIIAFAALLSSTGCKKVLDKEPLAVTVEENFYKTDQDMLNAVNAAYNPLEAESDNSGSNYASIWTYGDIVSDDARKGGGSLGDIAYWNNDETFTASADDAGLSITWTNQYLGIHRANIVLEHAPTSSASDAIKAQVTGEAKFLRAYYHFYLVRMFGDVPLITSVLSQTEFEQPRTSKDLVYKQIEQDLIDAAALLPEKGSVAAGRATKGAALGLLTRVYLFQSKWTETLATAQTIISSGKYDLLPIASAAKLDSGFASIFAVANKNSIESLFEIQFTPQGTSTWATTTGSFINVMTRGRKNSGWGFDLPTINLYKSYKSGDPRREGTILKSGDVLFGNIVNKDGSRGERILPDWEDTTVYPGTPYHKRKYIEPIDPASTNQSDGPSNFIVVRYADILLMAAEAAANLGQDGIAQDYVNKVRARVKLNPLTATGETLKAAIWDERRWELAMEGLRFFDIVRQGRAGQIMPKTGNAAFQEGKLFRPGISEVFPIPQTEISLSRGLITQNPGY